jgi:S-adenosylmethionine decarboxylase
MLATPTSRASRAQQAYRPWGMLAAIDLHDCDRESLEDSDHIRGFVVTLVDAIEMCAHGPVLLERFGDGELEGWSAMQFIETSSITLHADEFGGRCFVDVFSCRPFDAERAAAVAVAHFGGTPTLRVLRR